MANSPVISQLTILIATIFAFLSSGSGIGFPGILLYQLRKNDTEIRINDIETSSWIGSIHGIGGLLGIIAPIIMQWRGRKFTFQVASFIIIAGWVIMYMANNVTMILVSESLHGFGANILMTVGFDSLTEMIAPAYRNNAVLSSVIFEVIGFALPGVFTTFLHWRKICIVMCLPAFVAFIISFYWLESPLWLAYKKDLEKSISNFITLRGNDELSVKEWKEVMAAREEILKKNRSKRKENVLKQCWRQICSRDFIIPSLHVYLLLHHIYWCGSMVVLIYSLELILKSTQNETVAFVGSTIINFGPAIGAALGNILMRFYNNKSILLVSTCGGTITLMSVALVTYLQSLGYIHAKSLITLYLLIVYMIAITSGQTSVSYTVSSELIPVKHRGVGGALFVIFSCGLHAWTLKTSSYLFLYMHVWGTFLLFAANSIICGLLIWKYIPETKGRTLQEIENYYSNGTFDIDVLDEEIKPIDVSIFK